MTEDLPDEIAALLEEIDAFIAAEIRPLEAEGRQRPLLRPSSRVRAHRLRGRRDPERRVGGAARGDGRARRPRRAVALRAAGGARRSRRHRTSRWRSCASTSTASAIGLHNDPQSEISMIGNFPTVILAHEFGTPAQREIVRRGRPAAGGRARVRADRAQPRLRRDLPGDDRAPRRRRMGDRRRQALQLGHAPREPRPGLRAHLGLAGRAERHHRLHRPARRARPERGLLLVDVQHAQRPRRGVAATTCAWATRRSSASSTAGLALAQRFVHENRIRQAASSLGAAALLHRRGRRRGRASAPCGASRCGGTRASSSRWPSCGPNASSCAGSCAGRPPSSTATTTCEVTHLVAMANYRANRLACEAADRAMQTCGGIGYTRHMPFEHIYRHHRRYRITEGSEEVQLRKVGYELFKGAAAEGRTRSPSGSAAPGRALPPARERRLACGRRKACGGVSGHRRGSLVPVRAG